MNNSNWHLLLWTLSAPIMILVSPKQLNCKQRPTSPVHHCIHNIELCFRWFTQSTYYNMQFLLLLLLLDTPWSCSCRLKEKFFPGVIFLVQYISQTLPKIPDAPTKLQRPTLAPRRSLEFTDAPVNPQTLPESSQRFRFHWQTMWLVRAYNIGYIIIFDS